MVAARQEILWVTCHERYLGLPTAVGRGRKQVFRATKDRILKWIGGWKEKRLSRAGKEVLIKAILQVLPTYSMNCFRMPKDVAKEIHARSAKFWWEKSEKWAWDSLDEMGAVMYEQSGWWVGISRVGKFQSEFISKTMLDTVH
ncbi:hypothetical protein EV1_038668 [Malus domestica]